MEIEESIDLREIFVVLKKRFAIILAVTLLAGVLSAVYSFVFIKPVYKADISVIIGRTQSTTQANANSTYSDLLMYQKMVKSYSELTKSKTLARQVINKLNLNMSEDAFSSSISTLPKGDTEFLTITVKNSDPKVAKDIANETAAELKELGKTLNNSDNVYILDDALLPTSPINKKPALNIAIALLLGLMISVGIVFLIEYLDVTIKSETELTALINVPVLGIIPSADIKN